MDEVSFEKTGRLYDLLHEGSKDYQVESVVLEQMIRAVNPDARRLLDVACGTGEHLAYLSSYFYTAGLDVDPAMLDVAIEKVGPASFHLGDMTDFQLDERFDAITCLFSSIGYLADEAALQAAIANMAQHLSPGGVVVIEPWHHSNVWSENHSFATAAVTPERSVSRVMKVTVEPSDSGHATSVLSMHFGIADADGIRSFDQEHRLTLFPEAAYLAAFESAGLTVTHDSEGITGRGLFIGVKAAQISGP